MTCKLFIIQKILYRLPFGFRKNHSREICANHLICDTLRDLVPFVQFKKRDKLLSLVKLSQVASTYKSVTSACNFTRSITPSWVYFTFFLNCRNGTKSRKASHT